VKLAYRYFHVKAQIVHTLVQERMDEVLLQVELLGQGVLALETIAGIFRHLDEDHR
jgi:hypothetical protein